MSSSQGRSPQDNPTERVYVFLKEQAQGEGYFLVGPLLALPVFTSQKSAMDCHSSGMLGRERLTLRPHDRSAFQAALKQVSALGVTHCSVDPEDQKQPGSLVPVAQAVALLRL